MTAMDISIQMAFLPHDDPDASLAFYRDTLGFEVRNGLPAAADRTDCPSTQPPARCAGR